MHQESNTRSTSVTRPRLPEIATAAPPSDRHGNTPGLSPVPLTCACLFHSPPLHYTLDLKPKLCPYSPDPLIHNSTNGLDSFCFQPYASSTTYCVVPVPFVLTLRCNTTGIFPSFFFSPASFLGRLLSIEDN